MNKKITIAAVMSSVIVLGGATMYQQAHAAKSPVSSEPADPVVETTRSSEAALQGTPIYGSISLEQFEANNEINIYQIKSLDRNPRSAIDTQQASFDPSFITIGDIQGHPAILEDTSSRKGGSKKQVWIATEDYDYVLHTGSPTITLSALKEIAEKINF